MKKCTCLLTSAVNGCWSPSETERWTTASVIPVPVSSDRRPEAKRAKSDSEHDPNTYLTPVHHRDSFVDWKMPRQILEISETSRYKKDRPIHQSQLTFEGPGLSSFEAPSSKLETVFQSGSPCPQILEGTIQTPSLCSARVYLRHRVYWWKRFRWCKYYKRSVCMSSQTLHLPLTCP